MIKEQLTNFLRSAHKGTYAAGSPKAASSRLNSEDFEFQDGNFLYHDTYFGDDKFIGEEVIYENSIPVWGMNYYGYLMDEFALPKDVYSFLKQALRAEEDEAVPVRGPSFFDAGGKIYKTSLEGTIENFTGEEVIEQSGKVIYKAVFHGGSIQGKE